MSAEDNPRRALDGILDGLAESIAREDTRELLEESRAAGQNPETVAGNLKRIFQNALKKYEQKKLEAAREAYRLHSADRTKKTPRLASTPEGRKRQLATILKCNPDIGAALTTQYRGFEELSDQDVESALEDLVDLGYLDDTRDIPSEK